MSATPPDAKDAGAKAVPPDLITAWPRSSQYALAFLIVVALGLITAHVVLGRLTDARPTTLDAEKVLTKALDLNKADAVQLRQVPEIGDKLAPAIIEYRRSRGGFGSVEELLNVPGIGKTKLERIRPWVYVENEESTADEGTTTPVSTPAKKTTGGKSRGSKRGGLKGPVDLNTASEELLKKVDGIGPVLARRIVEARERQLFRSVEDLLKIHGIKQKTLDRVCPFVIVSRDENSAD